MHYTKRLSALYIIDTLQKKFTSAKDEKSEFFFNQQVIKGQVVLLLPLSINRKVAVY